VSLPPYARYPAGDATLTHRTRWRCRSLLGHVGAAPFFEMPIEEVPIHGLAICRYEQGPGYRFSCDSSWEVQNDSPYDTVEQAMRSPSGQYDVSKVTWVKA
jgi:hypothetical protein